MDWFFLSLVAVLMFYGLFVLRSAVLGEAEGLFVRQVFWNVMGFSLMVSMLFVREDTVKRFSKLLYVLALAFLVAVLFVGTEAGGSRRWIRTPVGGFQPSDLAKLALIVLLPEVLTEGRFWLSLTLATVPAALVFVEPDLGTSVALIVVWFFAVLASRVRKKPLWILLLLCVAFFPIFFFFGLKDYQRVRILAFLEPEKYGKTYSYNVIQSMSAIGSGGLFGKGYMRGTANLMGLVPIAHTDFIVSVIGEEFGFLGILFTVSLYSLLLFRIARWLPHVKSEYWEILMVSASSLLWFHVLENVSMCLGLLPVTGIPLPFVSYGGSSTLTFSTIMGLVLKGIAIARIERKE